MKWKQLFCIITGFLAVLLLGSTDNFAFAGLVGEKVTQEWAAHFGDETEFDTVLDMANDAQGNVYLAGCTKKYDAVVIKYDSDGRRLWASEYNSPTNGDERFIAVGADADGNVYAAGQTKPDLNNPWSSDIIVMKYDSSGNQLWFDLYQGYGSKLDYVTDLELDDMGNAYITGVTFNRYTDEDYITIRYSPEGQRTWVAFYDSNNPHAGHDYGRSMTLDGEGNVYVTGNSHNDDYEIADILTVKYNRDGIEQWTARYRGAYGGNDYGQDIAVDAQGFVYVFGEETSANSMNYTTLKYANDGQLLWVANYNNDEANGSEVAYALAVSSKGEVYVTGRSQGLSTQYDYLTIKYKSNGEMDWIQRYDGDGQNDFPANLALDKDGSVYVTGESIEFGPGLERGKNFHTIKYDDQGRQKWAVSYDSAPFNSDDSGRCILLDASGNIYVTGESFETASMDITLVKYSQSALIRSIQGMK